MDWLKDFINSILNPIGELLGVRNLYAGLILLAVIVVLATAITLAIAFSAKAKNKKKQAVVLATDGDESEISSKSTTPVVEEIKESKEEKTVPTVEEIKDEPKKEIKPIDKEIKEKPMSVTKTSKTNKKTEEKKEPVKKSLPGKWLVEIKSADEFMSKLLASNGEVMLSSEIYSSEEGARTGIATIIKWVEDGKFVIYQDKKNKFYYKLKTSGNRLICVGEIYKSEEQCLKAVETVKRIARSAIIVEELFEADKYIDYKPVVLDGEITGPKGKWKIESPTEGKFSAKLYASNGQLMMATEEVSHKKTAVNAIESVKKNAFDGNFIIDRDKFGRFYYKLRNSQKSVICIGEAYDSLDACTKALESVRRFAINSIVVE